jgi:hypothetical protein
MFSLSLLRIAERSEVLVASTVYVAVGTVGLIQLELAMVRVRDQC